MANAYYRQKEDLLGSFDLNRAQQTVLDWSMARALIWNYNRTDFEGTRQHLTEELNEARVEANLRGTEDYSSTAEHTEATDGFFLMFVLAQTQLGPDFRFDLDDLRSMVNGQGKKSNIIDRIQEGAGNVERPTLARDLSRVVADTISYVIAQPEPYDPKQSFGTVLSKNAANYPIEIYAATDYRTGRPIPEEDYLSAYSHRKTAANGVRRTLGRPYGMKREDYVNYLPHIMDYQHSSQAMLGLAQQFELDHGIPLRMKQPQ